MTDPVATSISLAALLGSGITAWLTLFRRGTVHMTNPTFVAFSYDNLGKADRPSSPKVFLRALIYSTGKRGHIVENMFVTLRRGETRQTFNVWGHGDDKLVRGSGMFIGEAGVGSNHHFNPPEDAADYVFVPGQYQLDVFAAVVGFRNPSRLCSVTLTVPESAQALQQAPEFAYWFDWGPDSAQYQGHLERRADIRAAGFGTPDGRRFEVLPIGYTIDLNVQFPYVEVRLYAINYLVRQ